jgi:hypothetical protein
MNKIFKAEKKEDWKDQEEREVNEIPINVHEQDGGAGFFVSFDAENNDEAWILNSAIDKVLVDRALVFSYEGDEGNRQFAGRHNWKIVGQIKNDTKELINAIKRKAIEIKSGELIAA